MNQSERDENRAQVGRYENRIRELNARRQKLKGTLAAVSIDDAMGDEAASMAAREAREEDAGLSAQIDTLSNAIDRLEEEYRADAPLRAAEQLALRKGAAGKVALQVVAASEEGDAALRALVAAVSKRQAAIAKFGEYRDVVERDPYEIASLIDTAIAAAGLQQFAPQKFMTQPMGPNTLAERDAAVLGYLLPADHPAVQANQKRQDAINAEHLRQQGQHTPIAGPKVTVVSPGRR